MKTLKHLAILGLGIAAGPALAASSVLATTEGNEIGKMVYYGNSPGIYAKILDKDAQKPIKSTHPYLSPTLFYSLIEEAKSPEAQARKAALEQKIVETNAMDSFETDRDCIVKSKNPYRIVFAFEGFGGYEPGVMHFLRETGREGLVALTADAYAVAQIKANTYGKKVIDNLSPEERKNLEDQVLNVRPIDNSLSESSLAEGPVAQVLAVSKVDEWYYFSQDRFSSGVAQAVDCAKRLAGLSYGVDAGGARLYPSLVVLGFSNGGDAAHMFAEAMADAGIKIDLTFTMDPVPHDIDILDADRVFWSPPNVKRWINIFQNSDEGSLAGIPLMGNPVEGATSNIQVSVENTTSDHVFLPSTQFAMEQFATELDAIPVSRTGFEFDPQVYHQAAYDRGMQRFDANRQTQRKFLGRRNR